jgi:transposase-like protein
VINTDGHAAYPSAVAQLKGEGDLTEDCRHRPVPYLNNVLEQDHRAIKRRVNASQHFRSFCAARRTLAGYEAIHMIRKGQASGSAFFYAEFACRSFCSSNCRVDRPSSE